MKNFTKTIYWILGMVAWVFLGYTQAQAQTLTVPDYAYGTIQSQQGRVTQQGIANPGPYGGYSIKEVERQNGISFAQGYRWWGYSSYPLLICGDFPEFSFPGKHPIIDNTEFGCANPPTGYMASWGGVIAEPASQSIWCLTGSKNLNGPTASYCIPNPFGPGQICYSPPSTWGFGSSYGYLRKAFAVQSTGALQKGDPAEVNASLTAAIANEGEGTATGMGVLFLNRISEAPWYQSGFGREYLTWGTIEDFFGSPVPIIQLAINQSGTEEFMTNVAIGDTIIVEVGFNNTIKHPNPGITGESHEGWSGRKPPGMPNNIFLARHDSIMKIIKIYGNKLTYNLTSLTQGALLIPLAANGPNTDDDKDGVTDAREKGPNGDDEAYDGNSDGIPDYLQANVASFHTYDGSQYVTLEIPAGKELTQVVATNNPSPGNIPEDAEFPWGFFDFSINGLEPGEAITVTLILPQDVTANKYFKYGMTPDNLEPHWYDFTYNNQTGAVIVGNKITLHFVDGLRGDDDIMANGSIAEPGGPAIAESTGLTEQLNREHQVSIYPNPVVSYFNIQMQNGQPGNHFTASIYTMEGKLVHQERLQVTNNHQTFTIGTNHLAAGVYVVKLAGNNITHQAKIIKLK